MAFSLHTESLKVLNRRVCVCLGFLLPVEICGTAWRVSGEHVQPGQSAAPDGSHTFGHTLLPEGTYTACTETGGKYTHTQIT